MSTDTIDDLHAAEDLAGQLGAALEKLYHEHDPMPGEAIAAIEAYREYCRPTCGWREDGDCASGEDTSGCPCEHGIAEPLLGAEMRWIAIATEGIATSDGRILEAGGIHTQRETVPLERPQGNMLCRRMGPRRIRKAGNQWVMAVHDDDLKPDEWVTPTILYESIEYRQEGDQQVGLVGTGELISAQVVKRDTLAWPHELLGVQ